MQCAKEVGEEEVGTAITDDSLEKFVVKGCGKERDFFLLLSLSFAFN